MFSLPRLFGSKKSKKARSRQQSLLRRPLDVEKIEQRLLFAVNPITDYNADDVSDIAFHRPGGPWQSVPVLVSNHNGGWTERNSPAPSWANQPGVVSISGDFNADGRTDIAFHRPGGPWNTVPVLFSNPDGSWRETNLAAPSWANQPGVIALPGYYNNDGRVDIAFYRPGSNWNTTPVLLSNGDGSWSSTNVATPSWANQPGVVAIPGDFNADLRTDIAFHRPGSTWNTVPVLFSNANGGWNATNLSAPAWANQPGVVAVTGNYDGDWQTDIAFHRPGSDWQSVPVLLSNGDGSWADVNFAAPAWPSWANQPGVVALSGDYNSDGLFDIAFHRPGGAWNTLPILFANGNGTWRSTNNAAPAFVNQQGVVAVTGDYNGDTRSDLAFYRPDSTWNRVPILFSDGNGNWTEELGSAPAWANDPGIVAVDPRRPVDKNVPPSLTLGGTVGYTENASPIQLTAVATVTDEDDRDFGGGYVIANIVNVEPGDRLSIAAASNFTVSNGVLSYLGTPIGEFTNSNYDGRLGLLLPSFNASATPAIVQELVRAITFSHVGDNPSSNLRSVAFSVYDGADYSESRTVFVNVTPVNDPPALTGGGAVFYTENGSPVELNPMATVSDVDAQDYDGATLTVTNANGDSGDRLRIGGGFSVFNGSISTRSWIVIGAVTGGEGTTPMIVTFNNRATAADVRDVMRSITFTHDGDNPTSTQRAVAFQISDGDGGSSEVRTTFVNVTPVNDAPSLTGGGTASYTENAAPVQLNATGTATDADSPNFDAGALTVANTNGDAGDRLVIRAMSNFTVSGGVVSRLGTPIGTVTGGSGQTPLVVTFNASATPAIVQELSQSIGFRHAGENPTSTQRVITFQVSDGDGGSSQVLTQSVNVTPVNDAPVLGGINGTVGYTRNAAAGVQLASTARVTDADSANFDTGRLTVAITSGGNASNRLQLGGTLFTLNGQNVVRTVNGTSTVIGTLNANGGVGTTSFEVTFNANATAGIVQQLVRAMRFRTVGSTSTVQRVVSFTVTDGDGGTSNTLTKTVNVT